MSEWTSERHILLVQRGVSVGFLGRCGSGASDGGVNVFQWARLRSRDQRYVQGR